MGLGIVSNEDFEAELNNSSRDVLIPSESDPNKLVGEDINPRTLDNESNARNEPIQADVIDMKSVGRHNDISNVPQSLRKILSEEHALNGLQSTKELMHTLGGAGLSQPTLSTYGRGEISPGVKDNDLTNHINGRKTKITKRAMNKLNLALAQLDEDKMRGLEARELSGVAKDMAQIVKHMEPDTDNEKKKDPVQFHFYSPVIKNEAHYETIVAKDNY